MRGRGGEQVEAGLVVAGELDVVAGQGREVLEQAADAVDGQLVGGGFGAGFAVGGR
ncbi:MAG TPA: hypothetical protein VGN54_04090 [Mycobacteriales bacterium]|nr:hypothetical protein [Mycobacteriales bacterium]